MGTRWATFRDRAGREDRRHGWNAAWIALFVFIGGVGSSFLAPAVSGRKVDIALLIPGIICGLLAVFALYLVFAPLLDLWPHNHPTPNERLLARNVRERNELDATNRALKEAHREAESHRWQCAVWNAVNRAGGEWVYCIEIHKPEKSDAESFRGMTVTCELSQSSFVYESIVPAVFSEIRPDSFVFSYPSDFVAQQGSPQPSLDTPNWGTYRTCHYEICCRSSVFDSQYHWKFDVDASGRVIQ